MKALIGNAVIFVLAATVILGLVGYIMYLKHKKDTSYSVVNDGGKLTVLPPVKPPKTTTTKTEPGAKPAREVPAGETIPARQTVTA